jgi:hypothetical protein
MSHRVKCQNKHTLAKNKEPSFSISASPLIIMQASSIVTSKTKQKTQSAAEPNKRTTSAAQYSRMIRGISTQLALRVNIEEH